MGICEARQSFQVLCNRVLGMQYLFALRYGCVRNRTHHDQTLQENRNVRYVWVESSKRIKLILFCFSEEHLMSLWSKRIVEKKTIHRTARNRFTQKGKHLCVVWTTDEPWDPRIGILIFFLSPWPESWMFWMLCFVPVLGLSGSGH